MRILKGVGVFQAEAINPVQGGMDEEDDPGQLPRHAAQQDPQKLYEFGTLPKMC